jgi:hypothetical protein
MASYHHTRDEFELNFKPTAAANAIHQTYHWSGTHGRKNPATRKSYNPPSTNEPVNQTTFIHGWSISLPTGLWGSLWGTVETPSIVDFQSRINTARGSSSGSPQGSLFSWSWNFLTGGRTSGGKQHAGENEAVVLSELSPIAMVSYFQYHQSSLTNGP